MSTRIQRVERSFFFPPPVQNQRPCAHLLIIITLSSSAVLTAHGEIEVSSTLRVVFSAAESAVLPHVRTRSGSSTQTHALHCAMMWTLLFSRLHARAYAALTPEAFDRVIPPVQRVLLFKNSFCFERVPQTTPIVSCTKTFRSSRK